MTDMYDRDRYLFSSPFLLPNPVPTVGKVAVPLTPTDSQSLHSEWLKDSFEDLDYKMQSTGNLVKAITDLEEKLELVQKQLEMERHRVQTQSRTIDSLQAELNRTNAGLGSSNGDPLKHRCLSPSLEGNGHRKVRFPSTEGAIEVTDETVEWQGALDRIIHQIDQQASVYLQQRLKSLSHSKRQALCALVSQRTLALATNRFGNFLIQRCLETCSADLIAPIVHVIKSNVISMACDPFGCHVVQKALDLVNENDKSIIVSAIVSDIPLTITHKHACHVWQKILETRWQSKTNVIPTLLDAMKGTWKDVAMNEIGSLVTQNLFENCHRDDIEPLLEEILDNVVAISKGQWGNWVIQHILEYGSDKDRQRLVETLIDKVVIMSTDQYASKVIEKALRLGGPTTLKRMAQVLFKLFADRTRIALIDVAADQYGNYVVQHILTSADPELRQSCIQHIRRHLVSLRGTKYGQKVALLVEKLGKKGGDYRPDFERREKHRR